MKENYLDMLRGNPHNQEATDKLLDIFLDEHPETLDDDQEERFEKWLLNELGLPRVERTKPGITSDPAYPPQETEESNEEYKRQIQ